MFPWEAENKTPKRLFVLPLLPKPHYQALQRLCTLLKADQWEVICTLIELATIKLDLERQHLEKRSRDELRSYLAGFRGTAPSEADLPLIDL